MVDMSKVSDLVEAVLDGPDHLTNFYLIGGDQAKAWEAWEPYVAAIPPAPPAGELTIKSYKLGVDGPSAVQVPGGTWTILWEGPNTMPPGTKALVANDGDAVHAEIPPEPTPEGVWVDADSAKGAWITASGGAPAAIPFDCTLPKPADGWNTPIIFNPKTLAMLLQAATIKPMQALDATKNPYSGLAPDDFDKPPAIGRITPIKVGGKFVRRYPGH